MSRISPLPVRTRLPKSIHPDIVEAYQDGATSRELAELYEVSKANIESILHRSEVTMRKQPLTPDQIDEAHRLHAQGLSTYKIAARFGVVQSTVWRALQ